MISSHTDNVGSLISRAELKAQLVAFARELGFDSCRVTACAPPTHAEEFRDWLKEGAAGEMSYMERCEEKRRDPQEVLPGARSIIFLAEILTTLELSPDPTTRDRCGKCERCINACPTGAITAPHRLDARRCISYLTIELKGSIPVEFRSLIGDRIFGCDDCLDACPWNRFAKVSRESAFSAQRSTIGMALRDYLGLSDAEFRNLFRNSPIRRIKRRGFLRNVCVAMGNVGTVEDLTALERAAADPEPLIAEHAAWATKRIRERFGGEKAQSN